MYCTIPCQGGNYLQYHQQLVFGALEWRALAWFVSFQSHVEERLSLWGWTWRHSTEVTEMSSLSGLIYFWLVNAVCQEVQMICIYSLILTRRIAALMGKVFEMPAPCVVLVQITGGIHRKLSVLWNHFDLSQSWELDRPPSVCYWSTNPSSWPSSGQREHRAASLKTETALRIKGKDSTKKTQLLLGIEKGTFDFIVLIYTVNMHLITTSFNILHNWE